MNHTDFIVSSCMENSIGLIFFFVGGGGGGGLVCCFTSLSKAMVMLGRSFHLTTLFFLGKLEQAVNQYLVHIHCTFACN